MKKTLFTLLAVLSILFAATANAQNIKVSGKVSDAMGPVAGAAVLIQGTTTGVVTELNGAYAIDAPANAVLEVSCIGYKTVTEPVNGRNIVNITLEEEAELIADAVVLGYGAQTKKKDLSAAVGVLAQPERLALAPVSSTNAMLQGQIPGVTVTSNGGSPESSPQVVIRGQGSKSTESVLWVIDGVPGAPLNSVSDIESVVVLKDAASAAIYGASSGAGGVILITTKKAEKGVSVTYDGLVGIREAAKLPQSLDALQQREMRIQSYTNAGFSIPEGWDLEKNPWAGVTRTNWVDEVFRTALYHRHNVVVNAGTDKIKNRVSLKYLDEDGVLVSTFKKSTGFNYRGEYQIDKWIKVTEDFNYTISNSRDQSNSNSGYGGVIANAIYRSQSASFWNYKGTGYGGTTTEDPAYLERYGSNFSSIYDESYHPVRLLEEDTRYKQNQNVFSTTGLEIGNIVKGLKFNSRFSYYRNAQFYKNFTHMRVEIGKADPSNSLSYSTYEEKGWKTENTLSFDRTFGKHNVGALVASTADYYIRRDFSASENGFADESEYLQYFTWGDASTAKVTDSMTGPDANVAVISRVSYSYDDRYFVTASWRRDYAGRLPDNCNYGDFPAVTGAWKISSEPFFPKNDIVTLLKIRSSWGRIGNLGSVGRNYKSLVLGSNSYTQQAAQYGYETNAGYTGKVYSVKTALNTNLTWETSEQFDLGLDIDMFKDRLSASFDFYDKRTFNLIQGQTSGWTQSIGVDPRTVNLGEVKNRGIEMQIGWSDRKGDFSYYINANAAYNKNWISDIGVQNADGSKGVWTGSSDYSYRAMPTVYQSIEGGPINQYYMINCLGIFQSDEEAQNYVGPDGKRIQPNAVAGDLKFEDVNGDGKIDSNDRQYFGNAAPDWTFAMNLGLTWKNLSFSMMLQGVEGAQSAYMAKYMLVGDVEGTMNRSVEILNAWSPTNKSSNIPRLSKNDPNQNFSTLSTWYLEDASYLRIKNVTLSYDLTNAVRSLAYFKERGSSLMFYFSGENLFTFTKYSGMDPECGGFDALRYPVSRVLSLGVKLTY